VSAQCVGCGTVLPPERRSPRCPRCWMEYQRDRNRKKVRQYRARLREARVNVPAGGEERLPNEGELDWLYELGLGLSEPIDTMIELLRSGRKIDDPQVVQLAADALRRYDDLRADFDDRARSRSDPENLADSWRGFFESVRRALR
jgi:hypothetical protein